MALLRRGLAAPDHRQAESSSQSRRLYRLAKRGAPGAEDPRSRPRFPFGPGLPARVAEAIATRGLRGGWVAAGPGPEPVPTGERRAREREWGQGAPQEPAKSAGAGELRRAGEPRWGRLIWSSVRESPTPRLVVHLVCKRTPLFAGRAIGRRLARIAPTRSRLTPIWPLIRRVARWACNRTQQRHRTPPRGSPNHASRPPVRPFARGVCSDRSVGRRRRIQPLTAIAREPAARDSRR